MKVCVAHGESAEIEFIKEDEIDDDFESVVLEFFPHEKRPEDYKSIKAKWESVSALYEY